MPSEKNYVLSAQGIFKILNIVLGIITIGCVVGAADEDLKFEKFFLAAAATCVTASIMFFPIFLLTSKLDNNRSIKIIDGFYHVVLGIVLIVGSGMMLHSAVKEKKGDIPYSTDIRTDGEKYFDRKVAAGSFGVINSLLYFAASVFVLSSQNEDELTFRNYPKSG